MAGAVHNADKGQMPVLIFAGSAPFTANGELRGSKDDYGMWLQGRLLLAIQRNLTALVKFALLHMLLGTSFDLDGS